MGKLIIALPLIFGAQVAMALLFYRSRVISHAPWTESDFVVFGLPLVFGIAISACVLFSKFREMSAWARVTATFGLSVIGAVVASVASVLIAFNVYGT